jgi:hypothetical protein
VAVDELSVEIEFSASAASMDMMRDALAATLARLEAAQTVASTLGDHAAAAAERVFAAGGDVCHLRLTCRDRVLTVVVSSTNAQVWKTRRTLA